MMQVSGQPLSFAEAYRQLLALFPEDRPGRGIDRGGPEGVVADQPMTVGLVLSSESIRCRALPDAEGWQRVRAASRWLVDNSRLGDDGKPGWGLPHAWEHRPENTSFTITTAIALEGLLDALLLPGWSASESGEMLSLARHVCARWTNDLWAEGYTGGYFAYSPRDMAPPFFCINAPAMFLGALARLIREHAAAIPDGERRRLQGFGDALARACVATAELRGGAPFWEYIAQPNPLNSKRPNDLLHHAYILWGIETYRAAGGIVSLPWSHAAAVESLDRFWKDGTLRFMAQDEATVSPARREEPANVWGAGALLACLARWNRADAAARCFAAICAAYGPFPRVRVLPAAVSDDARFYPRDAAHVLLGLAYAAFR